MIAETREDLHGADKLFDVLEKRYMTDERERFDEARRLVTAALESLVRGSRYVVTFRDPYGRQRKKFARTLGEARNLKAALTADVRRGEYRQLSRVSFVDYAREWIETYNGRTRPIRAATKADYRKRIEQDAIPFFGRMELAAIEPRDLKRFAKTLESRGLAPNTVRLALAPVKVLLATAVEEGLIRANPSAGVRIVTASTGEETDAEGEDAKALTEEQLRALLDELPERWRLFFEFLAHSGLRIGEAIALRWEDVDLGRCRVRVRLLPRRLRQAEEQIRTARDPPLAGGGAGPPAAARRPRRRRPGLHVRAGDADRPGEPRAARPEAGGRAGGARRDGQRRSRRASA